MPKRHGPGSGRRPVDDGRVLVALGVRVTPTALAALKDRAYEDNRPVAHVIGELVEREFQPTGEDEREGKGE